MSALVIALVVACVFGAIATVLLLLAGGSRFDDADDRHRIERMRVLAARRDALVERVYDLPAVEPKR